MAKVKGPLFSMSASGQIAKSLVYLSWKGLKTVRQYVIPANPDSDDQKIQRGYFRDAIEAWHLVPWTAEDRIAWNLFSSIEAKVMSGFNSFVKTVVNTKVLLKTFYPCYNYADTPADTTASIEFTTSLTVGLGAILKYGTSKTSMTGEKAAVVAAGKITFALTGLIAETKYFCKVIPNNALKYTYSGIYTFTTTD